MCVLVGGLELRRDTCMNPQVTWDEVEFAYVRLQSNVREFFSHVHLSSDGRGLRISYEDLLRQPVETLSTVCQLLGLEFESGMDEPYESEDTLASFQAGSLLAAIDPKLLQRKKIDATQADKWRTVILPQPLWGEARDLAQWYGYLRE